ncbi:NAD-dependent epimerase/dehydratase family protein [Brevundimonas sp.]|uniref:NAD-dependent epimerase/dehydratase family protein n=1 Tax=Brevundimonas sp. TaxID=1871086 RepID=UPI001A1BBF2F|nr:NAD-dependent epimerase/dehydratase family protein [Brevundimonas sp.]MBJ7484684.1 NAD-dependent epimerase/dehydratase family protein [Brevundimonas sp.]
MTITGPVLVTGADGFIGMRLVDRLLEHPRFTDAQLVLNDRALDASADGSRVRLVAGDFANPAVRAELVREPPSHVFHLAGVLGGAAEADPVTARRVNVEGTLALLEALHRPEAPPRVVFASSIAVFAPPFERQIDDETRPNPCMIYGAQKLMGEIAIQQASARGWIDGLAVRLPGVVARPGADVRLKSAFLNRLFFAVRDGEAITLPVVPSGTTWLLSADACVEALVDAALVLRQRIDRRAFTLPAQCVRFDALVATLKARFTESPAQVSFSLDPEIQAQFGSQPPLSTAIADRLGLKHDGDLVTLVARAL